MSPKWPLFVKRRNTQFLTKENKLEILQKLLNGEGRISLVKFCRIVTLSISDIKAKKDILEKLNLKLDSKKRDTEEKNSFFS